MIEFAIRVLRSFSKRFIFLPSSGLQPQSGELGHALFVGVQAVDGLIGAVQLGQVYDVHAELFGAVTNDGVVVCKVSKHSGSM